MMKQFSIKEAIRFGWETTKKNFKFLLKVMLVVGAVYLVSGFINEVFKDTPVINVLLNVLAWIIQVVIGIGLIKVALKLTGDQKADLEDLYNHYPLFLKYILASLLTGLIVLGGFILLIIPGIIFSIRLQFVSYLIIDQNLGPVEAVKKSWQITKGNTVNLALFGLATLGVTILGFLALVVGLLWAIPTTSIATAFVYRKLLK